MTKVSRFPENIEEIDISACTITDLSMFQGCTKLRLLVIMMCNKFINCPFTDLDSMPELPALEYLVLDAFPNLQKLDRLTIFTTLKVLYLRMLNKIIDIRPLGDIENLGLLDLTGTRFSPSAPSHIILGSEIRTICNETWSKSISLVESH